MRYSSVWFRLNLAYNLELNIYFKLLKLIIIYCINRIFLYNIESITEENIFKIIKEVKYLEKLSGDYIVDYISSWMQSNKCLCIQMEFCEYDLKTIITLKNQFNSSLNAINYYISYELFREILECVQYLHSRDPPIIHRDLKPENILIQMNNEKSRRFVKLCDTGLAIDHKIQTYSQSQRSLSHRLGVGTTGFMAPEVFNQLKFNTKADIFSIGVIAQNLFNEFDE